MQRYDHIRSTVEQTADSLNGDGIQRERIAFVVSPSLEDRFATYADFTRAAQRVASKIDFANLQTLAFRRTSVHGERGVAADVPSRTTLEVRARDGKPFRMTVEHEYHGLAANACGYQAFSNDGVFVRSDRDVDGSGRIDEDMKTANADGSTTKPTLANWLQQKPGLVKTSLLWRPADNLFDYGNPNAKYDVVAYNRPKDNRGREIAPEKRSERELAFNTLEMQVLRTFLGLSTAPPRVAAAGIAPMSTGQNGPTLGGTLTVSNAGARTVDLNWIRAVAADWLKIERSVDGTNFAEVATISSGESHFRVEGLQPGRTYTFRVRAVSGAGVSTGLAATATMAASSD